MLFLLNLLLLMFFKIYYLYCYRFKATRNRVKHLKLFARLRPPFWIRLFALQLFHYNIVVYPIYIWILIKHAVSANRFCTFNSEPTLVTRWRLTAVLFVRRMNWSVMLSSPIILVTSHWPSAMVRPRRKSQEWSRL